MMKHPPNILSKALKNILMTLNDHLGILFLVYLTNLAPNYSLKLEFVFQIYVNIGLTTILTLYPLFAFVVHYFLRCSRFSTQRKSLLNNVSGIVNSDVSILPNEHLYYIFVYGSNIYNFVSNKLIIT